MKTIITAGKLVPLSVKTGFDEYCFMRLCDSPQQEARRMERRRRDAARQKAKKISTNGFAAVILSATSSFVTRVLLK